MRFPCEWYITSLRHVCKLTAVQRISFKESEKEEKPRLTYLFSLKSKNRVQPISHCGKQCRVIRNLHTGARIIVSVYN